ncbi:MAG: ArsR family transcriptional regulator [Cenarchaeum sp. SB0661_bin_35]|nr:ArsR family transcriptional regulator [Cenarchaeum sp. SB0667_bin_13]MXY38088.1 ArsR family transcriptional regulator [Cenarchaeum sp. SB0664_bin_35]MXZ93438.1 ArsR family transcriptional regulator [Cenarchaeum sp. SB0666_bin_15]MYB46921.1 ArsR family transcriptional regulator [Cenarchaeum sp. SB0662_bin_33]MYC79550.1 ArsR family transcriptional regulator [Cenarchaeum sp. SB0661_bin_35]MYD58416.1 ArsR family transcriptional regulator [Cenarchaeum sp. SB0678_bin_8]MYG33726.1 ArsR family tra
MYEKPPILKLKEFDVTQKIIEALSNVYTRAILFSVRDEAKGVNQISTELEISISSVYKILTHLEDLALVTVERFYVEDRKKVKMYRSRIGRVEIFMTGMEPELMLYPNSEYRNGS